MLHRAGVGEGVVAVRAKVGYELADMRFGLRGECYLVALEAAAEDVEQLVCVVVVEDQRVVEVVDAVLCQRSRDRLV